MAQRLGQAVDRMPVQLQSRADDQFVVPDQAAAFEHHRVALRLECRDGGLDPVGAARDQRTHRAHGVPRLEGAAADQRPARLVVMDVGRVDDGDVEVGSAREQAGGDRDAGRAAADDHHVMLGLGDFERRAPGVGDAAGDAAQVVARAGRSVDDGGQRQPVRLRQRPQRGRAHAGPAVGQHRAGQAGEQRAELPSLRVAELAGFRRQVMRPDADGRRGLLDLGKQRLVIAFAVRTVADQRAEAGSLDRVHVRRHDLRRDRQVGGEGM